MLTALKLIKDPAAESYNALLTGSRILIQSAGHERFRSGFDRTMLELQRAPFVSFPMSPCLWALAFSFSPLSLIDSMWL